VVGGEPKSYTKERAVWDKKTMPKYGSASHDTDFRVFAPEFLIIVERLTILNESLLNPKQRRPLQQMIIILHMLH
jgi:hypothetical protein